MYLCSDVRITSLSVAQILLGRRTNKITVVKGRVFNLIIGMKTLSLIVTFVTGNIEKWKKTVNI